MLCPKCNKELPANGICLNCESESDKKSIQINQNNSITDYYISCKENMVRNLCEGNKTMIRTKTIIDITIIMILSIMLSFVISATFTSYVDKTIAAIEENSVAKAKGYYDDHIKDNKNERAVMNEELEKYLDSVIESYNVGDIDNAKAKEIIGIVTSAINDFDTNPYTTKVEVLKSSKAAFEDGYTSSAKGEYIKAIKKFGQVVEYDSNYETAQTRIDYEKTKYKNEIIDEINDALNEGSDYYAGAITETRELMESSIFENDPEIEQAYDKLVTTYVDWVEERIKTADETKQHKDMYNIASEGISRLGSNDVLQKWIDESVECIVSDALYDADVNIALGNYTQASETLIDALNYSSNDVQITVKLKSIVSDLAKMNGQL